MTIKIIIGADICPSQSNYQLFADGNLKDLVGEELDILLRSAQYTVFNLETPLTDYSSPLPKQGPALRAPTVTINGLKAINPHFFTLANNHILDQGKQGLQSTISLLKQAGISFAGAGETLPLAARPHIAYLKGIKVGIYCCAEHEFSIATENTPGANPYDPLVSFDSVRELKKRSDIVIVLYHGGKEHFRYPSPQLQRIFHKFADSGANLVIAQHTHCIGCWEDYQGAALVYGQGNFIFDSKDNEYWQTNLLVQLNIDETSKQIDIKWIPCIKQKNTVCLASPRQAKEILAAFYNRSQQILRTGFIQDNYQHFADTALNSYLRVCSGYWGRTLCARILNKILKDSLFIRIYKQKDLLHIQNILECEAHRETFLQSIKSREK